MEEGTEETIENVFRILAGGVYLGKQIEQLFL